MSGSKFSLKYCVVLPIVLILTILLWALPVEFYGIAGLTVVFLLRNILPFNFEATIVGTAASLGLLTVYFAYRLSRPE